MLALHVINTFTKDITSCFNDIVVKSLNKMVDSIAKTLNETQKLFLRLL